MTDALSKATRTTTAGERETLEAFLDTYRAILRRKLEGLSESDARRSTVPSGTTIGGLVKHLRWVEQGWIQRVLAGVPAEQLPASPSTPDDLDGDLRMTPEDTVDGLLADYDAECERSRETAARFELDDIGRHPRRGDVSLRWIYTHLIEETARHAGHADILREQIDGSTGLDV